MCEFQKALQSGLKIEVSTTPVRSDSGLPGDPVGHTIDDMIDTRLRNFKSDGTTKTGRAKCVTGANYELTVTGGCYV